MRLIIIIASRLSVRVVLDEQESFLPAWRVRSVCLLVGRGGGEPAFEDGSVMALASVGIRTGFPVNICAQSASTSTVDAVVSASGFVLTSLLISSVSPI